MDGKEKREGEEKQEKEKGKRTGKIDNSNANGMAATAKRARAAETMLIGQPWSEHAIRNAMQALDADYQPIGDMRASAAYRATVAKNLLFKAWLEISGAAATRVLELEALEHG